MSAYQFNDFGDVLLYLLLKLGKDTTGEYVSPEEISLVGNEQQLEFMNLCISDFENTRRVSDALVPFTKTRGDNHFGPIHLTEANSYSGEAALPDDCVFRVRSNYMEYLNDGCTKSSKYKSITFVTQAQFDEAMDMPFMSPVENPKEVNPIAVIQNALLRVIPNVKKISLTYLRKPASVFFDYDVINDEPVYLPPGQNHVNDSIQPQGTPSRSVEFEWPIQEWPAIVAMMERIFAINERSAFNIQTQQPVKV